MSSSRDNDTRKSLSGVPLEAGWTSRFALLLGAIVSLGGCIMLPLPASEKLLSGKPVAQEQHSFLTPQVTTKQEVTERLGNPTYIWEDARLFVYKWDMRQGIMLIAFPGGFGGVGDVPEQHVFIIQFDAQDRAQRWEAIVWPESQPLPALLRGWLNKHATPATGGSSGKQ